MKRTGLATMVLMTCAIVMCGQTALAQSSATMYVGSANATYQFEILSGGDELYYKPQPDTQHNWFYPDGSMVTYGTPPAPRDGMKTYAATSVAYGQTLDSVSLSLDYIPSGTPDPHGSDLVYQGYPNMNIAITDGTGTFAIWSATSGGTCYTTTEGTDGWWNLSMDLRTLADDSVYGKINESTNEAVLVNGKLNQTAVQWSDIKDWTVAGFFNEQFNPTGGFGAWNETLWSALSTGDDPATPEDEYTNTNPFGVVLFWGDTVGGMLGDGNGEIGLAAERPYGQGGKKIRNAVVGVGDTMYDLSFEAGVVPEPATMCLLGLGGMAGVFMKRSRRIGC